MYIAVAYKKKTQSEAIDLDDKNIRFEFKIYVNSNSIVRKYKWIQRT
jgi:hypothetical protein